VLQTAKVHKHSAVIYFEYSTLLFIFELVFTKQLFYYCVYVVNFLFIFKLFIFKTVLTIFIYALFGHTQTYRRFFAIEFINLFFI